MAVTLQSRVSDNRQHHRAEQITQECTMTDLLAQQLPHATTEAGNLDWQSLTSARARRTKPRTRQESAVRRTELSQGCLATGIGKSANALESGARQRSSNHAGVNLATTTQQNASPVNSKSGEHAACLRKRSETVGNRGASLQATRQTTRTPASENAIDRSH